MSTTIRIAMFICLALAACTSARSDNQVRPNAPNAQISIGPVPGPPQEHTAISNPFLNDANAALEGRRAFMRFNCYGCHGGHGGGGMGPSLRDRDWIYGESSAQIFDSIARGRANGMPSWGTRIPEQTIWQLTTYIETLASGNEPEPAIN